MIYVLLDTNIIIDMVVDRRHQINNHLLGKFVRLLDSDEIKLIIPEIIKEETYRHLEEEFDKVGKRIEQALDTISGLYGVATLKVDGLDLSEYKKNTRLELHKALTEFQSNKDVYKKDVMDTIELLFSHQNCILIDDITLMDKVIKRKFHQKAPFHKIEKESNGDGIITETLINIKQFITIAEEDKIYFVTGNYKDFSDTNQNGKDILHRDIRCDLQKSGLEDKVIYTRSFGQLVSKELKGNLEHVKLLEELEEQQQEEEELYYAEMSDLERESAGLSSLASFDSNVDEYLWRFREELERLEADFLDIDDEIDEILNFYQEECMELLSDIDSAKLPDILLRIKPFYPYCIDRTINCVYVFTQWLAEKVNEWDDINGTEKFSDIDYGESYSIYSKDGERYQLYVENKWLTLEEGSQDEISIRLVNEEDESEKWLGGIYITYGFMEYNDDGGIGDALEDEIDINVDDIIKQIQFIRDGWIEAIHEEKELISELRNAIEEV